MLMVVRSRAFFARAFRLLVVVVRSTTRLEVLYPSPGAGDACGAPCHVLYYTVTVLRFKTASRLSSPIERTPRDFLPPSGYFGVPLTDS